MFLTDVIDRHCPTQQLVFCNPHQLTCFHMSTPPCVFQHPSDPSLLSYRFALYLQQLLRAGIRLSLMLKSPLMLFN